MLSQQEANPLGSSPTGSLMPYTYRGEPGSRVMNYSDTERFSLPPDLLNRNQQQPLPPEPLTEFQRFVASTINQILPIYGASLFNRVPSTFAPLDFAPVPPNFVVGPGDELRVRIWGQVNFQNNLRIDRSGDVFLPQIGLVHVEGLRFSELDQHLRSAIGRVFHNFDLTVDVGQIRAIQIYVSGEARRPGVYTVSSLSTLVDALFASGGPSLQGSMRKIQLRRDGAIVTEFDLYRLLIRGDKSTDAALQSGDVIFIPPVGPQVAVTGSVRKPAIYEMLSSETLGDVIGHSGGASSIAAGSRISIERTGDHRDRHAMEVAFDPNGLTVPLADGDLVRVYSIVPAYQQTVFLRGNTANPGRFAWHAGMRVSDLIPDKEALITRDYWWRRAQFGLPASEFEAASDFDSSRQPEENNATNLKPLDQEQTRGSQQAGAQNAAGDRGAEQRASSASLASAQTPVDAQTAKSKQKRLAETGAPAPEIDWDYAVIERLDPQTLKTVLIPFDLGGVVLRHDASQDLTLNAGDVVSVFSEADIHIPSAHQTRTVILDGEFAHAGAYTALPGETLRQLVDRAGGLSPNAYLYGSEFTRETVRAVQQARIDEYARDLSERIHRTNLAIASSSVNATQDAASSTAAQASEQALLANLRQIRATGRIVLEIKPEDISTSSLPDIPLEDGDRFAVPPVPSSINVVGAVLDQNSFVYKRTSRAGIYLRLAGGPSRDADRSHEFIIRADGEVVSRDREKSLWAGDEFSNLRINPGDTIVVPEKIFKPTALRGLIEWSQVFSQLAFGAAALNVIQ
jgi:protein involved in polysaccharide export with SLBB domain